MKLVDSHLDSLCTDLVTWLPMQMNPLDSDSLECRRNCDLRAEGTTEISVKLRKQTRLPEGPVGDIDINQQPAGSSADTGEESTPSYQTESEI